MASPSCTHAENALLKHLGPIQERAERAIIAHNERLNALEAAVEGALEAPLLSARIAFLENVVVTLMNRLNAVELSSAGIQSAGGEKECPDEDEPPVVSCRPFQPTCHVAPKSAEALFETPQGGRARAWCPNSKSEEELITCSICEQVFCSKCEQSTSGGLLPGQCPKCWGISEYNMLSEAADTAKDALHLSASLMHLDERHKQPPISLTMPILTLPRLLAATS